MRLETDLDATGRRLTQAQNTITDPLGEPTIRTLPSDRLTTERDDWRLERDHRTREQYARSARLDADRRVPDVAYEHDRPVSAPDHTPGISR